MFATVAVMIFSGAFLLAVGTIGWMFALYHHKIVAALTFEPMPATPPIYEVRISRRRAPRDTRLPSSHLPAGALAA